jgi:nucleoside triphosphate pyrophosphatase
VPGGRLTLASGSPQRRAILEQLGVEFEVRPAGVEELAEGEPRAVAVENALRKARAVEGERVLGVDTVVTIEGRILDQPAGRAEAEAHLRALSGRTHQVWSGLALIEDGAERTAAAMTEVTFRPLSDSDIGGYLDTGEWKGRAGAYAIQETGSGLVAEIEGEYENVVGLPVSVLLKMDPSLSTEH